MKGRSISVSDIEGLLEMLMENYFIIPYHDYHNYSHYTISEFSIQEGIITLTSAYDFTLLINKEPYFHETDKGPVIDLMKDLYIKNGNRYIVSQNLVVPHMECHPISNFGFNYLKNKKLYRINGNNEEDYVKFFEITNRVNKSLFMISSLKSVLYDREYND